MASILMGFYLRNAGWSVRGYLRLVVIGMRLPCGRLGFLLFSTPRDAFGWFSGVTGVGTYLLKEIFLLVVWVAIALQYFRDWLRRSAFKRDVNDGHLILWKRMTCLDCDDSYDLAERNQYLSWKCKNKFVSTLYFKDVNTYIDFFLLLFWVCIKKKLPVEFALNISVP